MADQQTSNQLPQTEAAPARTRERLDVMGTLEVYLDNAQVGPDFPFSVADVCHILTENDWAISPEKINYLAATGQLAIPANGEYGPHDLLHLMGVCQLKRWWRFVQGAKHAGSFSKEERACIIARELPGYRERVEHMAQLTTIDIATSMMRTETEEGRLMWLHLLTIKLQFEGKKF